MARLAAAVVKEAKDDVEGAAAGAVTAKNEGARLVAVAAAAAVAAAPEANDVGGRWRRDRFMIVVAALCQGCCRAALLKPFCGAKEDLKLGRAAAEFEAAKPLVAVLAAARNMANKKEKKTRKVSTSTLTSTLFLLFLGRKKRKRKRRHSSLHK